MGRVGKGRDSVNREIPRLDSVSLSSSGRQRFIDRHVLAEDFTILAAVTESLRDFCAESRGNADRVVDRPCLSTSRHATDARSFTWWTPNGRLGDRVRFTMVKRAREESGHKRRCRF